MRTDYEEQCTFHFGGRPFPKPMIFLLAWLAIIIYGVGVPFFYATLLWKRRTWSLGTELNFLTIGYEPHALWWELIEVAKKLVFTGFLAIVEPGSLTQLFLAVTAALTFLVLLMQVSPYLSASDNLLAVISEAALTLSLIHI